MTNRDQIVDATRGFALLGIILVNIHYFSISSMDGWFAADMAQFPNQLGGWITASFFLAKFYILFSFLFGYSSTYVVKGTPENKSRWIRRSLVLIGLGFIHAQFFFHGDILFVYGVFGLFLWLFMFRKDSTIRGWAILFYVITGVGLFFVTVASFLADMFEPLSNEDFLSSSNLDSVMLSESFLGLVLPRAEVWVTALPGILLLQGPLVFVAFLLGLIAGRAKSLSTENLKETTANKLMGFGLGIGIPLQMLAALAMVWNFTGDVFSLGIFMVSLTVIFMTGGLVSAGILGVIGKLILRGRKLELLYSAGRNSLTIYLSQSIILSAVFAGWGFGLFGQTSVALDLVIGFTVWLVLSLLAVVLVRFKKRGPMEVVLTKLSGGGAPKRI
jgi:uncharacterized protein